MNNFAVWVNKPIEKEIDSSIVNKYRIQKSM